MKLEATATSLEGANKRISLQSIPDTCPVCHRNIHPKNIGNLLLSSRGLVQAIFRCTSQQCEEVFIATYRIGAERNGCRDCLFENIAPKIPEEHAFPQTIQDISPLFVDIYNQAIAAEASDLGEMVGIGLRKALEFLIKDFAIKQNSSKEDEIKKVTLGKCIKDYIDDTNVKQCAKLAAWLGNDETHYIRKWGDKDISDLKRLIHLTVNWIDNVLLTEHYMSEMDKPEEVPEQ